MNWMDSPSESHTFLCKLKYLCTLKFSFDFFLKRVEKINQLLRKKQNKTKLASDLVVKYSSSLQQFYWKIMFCSLKKIKTCPKTLQELADATTLASEQTRGKKQQRLGLLAHCIIREICHHLLLIVLSYFQVLSTVVFPVEY